MKKTVIAATLAAGLAVPAAAATIDFTADNATNGNVVGTTWSVTGGPGSLVNSTHWNEVGCTGQGWDFECAGTGPYDVGFGVTGFNGNEIDGQLEDAIDEFVEVVFGTVVKVTGFAGMLTYANNDIETGLEQVILEYWDGMAWIVGGTANPIFAVNQNGGSSFGTVGLAFETQLSILTSKVRFLAGGEGDSDDSSFNVTAAGLMVEVAPIPVPAGLPLLLTGLGALAWGARRKQRKAA